MVSKKILESFGYFPTVANHGLEVLELLKIQDCDLIFMDIIIPEMDEIETTKEIISNYKEKRPIIIAMTANAMIGDKEKFYPRDWMIIFPNLLCRKMSSMLLLNILNYAHTKKIDPLFFPFFFKKNQKQPDS